MESRLAMPAGSVADIEFYELYIMGGSHRVHLLAHAYLNRERFAPAFAFEGAVITGTWSFSRGINFAGFSARLIS